MTKERGSGGSKPSSNSSGNKTNHTGDKSTPLSKSVNSSSSSSSSNTSKSSKSNKSAKSQKSSSSSGGAGIKHKLKSFKTQMKSIKMPSSSSTSSAASSNTTKSDTGRGSAGGGQEAKSHGQQQPQASRQTISAASELTRQMQLNIEKQAAADRKLNHSSSDGSSWNGKFTLESKLSESFRSGTDFKSLKLKLTPSDPKSINEHGSVFTISKLKKDDSAMNLLSQAIRDDVDGVKKEETEIFVPGKGDNRCGQTDGSP